MNTEYLREFLALSVHGSFTKAAKSLYITQPALSKHIAALEKELDCELVERGRDGAYLTARGKALVGDARAIVKACDQMADRAKKLRDMRPESVKALVFGSDKLSRDALAAAIGELENDWPLLEVTVGEPPPHLAPCSLVETGEIDLFVGLTDSEIPYKDLDFRLLFKDAECISFAKTHRFAGKRSISVEELDGEVIHIPTEPRYTEKVSWLKRMFACNGVTPHYVPYDTAPGQNPYMLEFEEGVHPAPISLALYNMPPSRLTDRSFARLEGNDTLTCFYAVTKRSACNPSIAKVVEALERVSRDTRPDEYWGRLSGLAI